MKQIAEQADSLVKDMQIIVDNLAEYNPELCKEKLLCRLSNMTLQAWQESLLDFMGK